MLKIAPKIAPTVALAVALSLGVSAQEPATDQSPFPVSSALAESVSPDALARLDELVQSFVDDGDVVGAELLVIKNGRSILHEGYGLNDREAGTAMGTGNVFCVRSMTKPLIGTSILMLVADKQMKLSDPVSTYLPNFSGEGQRDITIENLLMHTSGLSMSQIMTADLTTIDGIQAVAEMGATAELLFEPGTNFNYSDQGTDTLTAVVEVVSGMTAADFVTTRILEPLEMEDSACLMEEGNPLRERGCVKYVGSRGNWSSFWSPKDKPLFPFFLGSQGLYSTLEDYGLFMEFWMNKGRARSGRLLRPSFVRKALVPNPFQFPIPTGMPNVESGYGFLMQLWTSANEDETKDKRELAAFGHTGSDGTHAWVLPDEKAIVLYFTQSRGTITGLRVEEALGELFLGEAFDPNEAAPPFEDYLGYYAEGPGHRYQSVILDGDDLALETPGKRIAALTYAGGDNWKFRDRPGVIMYFQRNEAGLITGFKLGEGEEFRFEPAADLPAIDEIALRVEETYRMDLLESIGPIRVLSTLEMPNLNLSGGSTTTVAWPSSYRVDSEMNGQSEQVSFDGEKVWYVGPGKPRAELDDARADAMREENPFTLFGNWSAFDAEPRVIQHLPGEERDILVIRVGDTSAPAMTIYYDQNTGHILRTDRMAFVEGMGRIGLQSTFSDLRDVSGALMPYKTSVDLPGTMIGTMSTTVNEVEIGVELPESFFELKE